MNQSPAIEILGRPAAEADVRGLAQLLVDIVDSGAAVSFLAPLPLPDAEKWWRETLQKAPTKAVFLVARDSLGICGTVQMQPAWAPNQPHRADIAKLMVHPRRRCAGLGRQLMSSIEEIARGSGVGLLVLDTKEGCAAESLYRKLGWIYGGTIPSFAFDPDCSALHAAVTYYKEVTPTVARKLLSQRRKVSV